MKKLPQSALKLFLAMAILCLNFSVSQGQAVAKEVFSSAVDHINCATIQFIHREAGRAEQANNMDCLSFESINKTIPADEAKTTGALCKAINDYKNKFSADKPLDAQLNAVIAYANGKIAAKKRKGNVEDFKASLEKIKKDALDEANGTSAGGPANNNAAGSNATDAHKPNNAANADTGQAIATPAADNNTPKSGHKTDWLGILGLLVGLGALGLAYAAYSKAKKTGTAQPYHAGSSTNMAANDTAMKEIKRLEAAMIRMKEEMEGKIREMNVPAEPRPVETTSAYAKLPTEPIEINEQHNSGPQSLPGQPFYEEPISEAVPQAPVTHEPEPIAPVAEHLEQPAAITEHQAETAHQPHHSLFEAKAEPVVQDLFAGPVAEPEPVVHETEPSVLHHEMHTAVADEPFMPEKEYEDGEAVPFYKFASLPDAEGYFGSNSFTDDPTADSVYEIEMYDDVPDRAFFSLLPNPELIRKAMQNPDVYLKPCCSYTDDPAGKRAIVLAEEGTLRKENGKWMVYDKAKINFE